MDKNKEAKFKIGDTVVIIMYGTVGKVTDVKWLDGMYVYEINKSEGLFMESSLQLISEYEKSSVEHERIEIECRFLIGDIVQVRGYGNDLFKIIGFRTEIWRYKEDAWEDVIYELSRLSDGKWMEAGEEELILIADTDHADVFIQKLGLLYSKNDSPKLLETQKHNNSTERKKKQLEDKWLHLALIDDLLDLYNDYRTLYEMFHDDQYKMMMQAILYQLQNVVKGDL